jgi:large conductance mechanosensitive channel
MWREFKAFLLKENVLSLAIAVVIGAALGRVVTALVDDFIMPIVGAATPAGDWRAWKVQAGPVAFGVGHFIGTLIDFLIIGFVVWRISKAFIKPPPAAAAPVTQPCPYCRMTIDAAATRCPHCTSELAGERTAGSVRG